MKTWKALLMVIFCILVGGVLVTRVGAASAGTGTVNLTSMVEDDYIRDDGVGDNWDGWLMFGYENVGGDAYRAFAEWNFSDSLTGFQNVNITGIKFYYDGSSNNENGYVTVLTLEPNATAHVALYAHIKAADACADPAGFPVVGSQQVITLNQTAIDAMQDAVDTGQLWFALGFVGENEAGPGLTTSTIDSSLKGGVDPTPTLEINFTYEANYTFTGTYFENGNKTTAVNVTAYSENTTQSFPVDGTVSKYYGEQPLRFVWTLPGGGTRRIWPVLPEESYLITVPYDSYAAYEFTIRDYIGILDSSTVYLESWAVINSTDTLIERAQVQDQISGVGLTLQQYQLYTIRVRYGGNTIEYEFIPGVDATPVIALRSFVFTDQAKGINRYVTVEATRNMTTGLNITGTYLASLTGTNLVEFNVTYKNGTSVYYTNSTLDSVAFQWNGADNETDYIATFIVNHTSFTGLRTAAFALGGVTDYDAVPDMGVIGEWGGMDTRYIIGIFVVIAVGSLFGAASITAGAFSMVFAAAVLSELGMLPLNYIQILSGGIAAVLLATSQRRR